MQLISFSSNLL